MQLAEQMISEVVAQEHLSDLHGDSFRIGLDALLDSIERDARLDDTTAASVDTTIRHRLRSRLRVEHWYATEGPPTEDAVAGPISIMGLPRTGTTALGNVMSLDPQFRPLRLWEQLDPWPPPLLETERDDPRRLAYVESTARLQEQRPELEAMHIYDTDATTEDVHLLGLEFRSQELTLPVLGYHRWWREGDMLDAYRYQRRVCTMLQSSRPPNRWLFKSPYHCYHLDAITEVYPDVRFVMTHRDPVKAIPSAVSFITTLYPPGAHAAHDMHELGPHYAEHLRVGLELEIDGRRRIGPDRVLDVHHRAYVADPMGLLERVYEFVGLELDATTRRAMEQWHATHHSGAHGTHQYRVEDFGLSEAQLRSDFKFYTDEYGIELDGSAP
jgi:sulfotransferase family protein